MKKLVAIFLLVTIFINQVGYYFFHNIQQYQLKREMKHALLSTIPDSELEIIFANNPIHWEEDGEEFYLNGHMYDVVRTGVLHGQKVYYCINDIKEKRLVERLVSLVKANDDSQRSRSGKVTVKFQLTDYEMPGNELTPPAFDNKPQYTDFISRLTSTAQEILSPPPRS